jgi:hypothetical protein
MTKPFLPRSNYLNGTADESFLAAGGRLGDRSTHTSRTLMLAELTQLMEASAPLGTSDAYKHSIIEDNCLGKETVSTRRLSAQRLHELYGLDRSIPIFRVLSRLWAVDVAGRPLLALLCAAARDPLVRASASIVIDTAEGNSFSRERLLACLRDAVGGRLNDEVLGKVARNLGSTWTQSGHLVGRVRKTRSVASPTPAVVAFAMWLGSQEGLRDGELLRSVWVRLLDRSESAILAFAQEAKRHGLIQLTIGGGVMSFDPGQLDPGKGEVNRGTH